jgi:hypothetical protein
VIVAAIEQQWGLDPVGAFADVPARDGLVSDLGPAIADGRKG